MSENTLQEFLLKLNQNYLILQEREAKYANAAPLDLLNQLDDYAYAIQVAQQAIQEQIPLEQLQNEFNGLNLQLSTVVFISQEPPRQPFTGRNPYRGLRKFTEDEAEFFFGRAAAVQSLLNTIQRLVQSGPSYDKPDLITVLGPSGSGKSSLVRAGLIPALRAGGLPGSEQWLIRNIVPGHHPFDELAAQFVELTGRGLPALRADLQLGDQALYQLMLESLTRANLPPESIFILVIDQFEEVFTLCQSASERQAFLDQILYVTRQTRCFIILTMRADFYDKAAGHKQLAHVITANQMLVSQMTEKELREAILLPAEAVGLELEKALVETLLNDTAGAPSVLPLLQQALTELFYYRDGNLLTLEAYQKIGGVKGALAHRADAILDSMPMTQRHMVRRIFMRLVQLGEGTADTRRRATLAEVIPQGSDAAETESIIQVLTDANLIVSGRNAETGEVVLDVSHEALIKEWPRFQSWLDWDRNGLRIRQQLAQATRDWEARQRDEDSLYRGARLLEAEEWAAANPGEINPSEAAFLRMSVTVRDRVATENRRRIRLVIIGLAAGLVMVTLGAIYGLVGQQEARKQAATADSERSIAQTAEARAAAGEKQALAQSLAAQAMPIYDAANDSELAALIAVEAAHLNEAGQGNAQALIDAVLRRVLNAPYFNRVLGGQEDGLFSLAISPDGQTLAAAGDMGRIYLWDMAQPYTPAILTGHSAAVRAVAFSPVIEPESGRQLLATGGDDAIIRLWDIKRPDSAPTLLSGSEGRVLALAFSPDGQNLAAADAVGTIRLWNMAGLTTEPKLIPNEGGLIQGLVFSPDGTTLAAAGIDGVLRLWSLSNLAQPPQMLAGDQVPALAVAFSPHGQALATAGSDGVIRLWDTADLAASPGLLRGHDQAVRSLAFNPDGKTLASAGFDGTVRLWNLDPRLNKPPLVLKGHQKAVRAVTFSPDGRTLASVGDDRQVRLWDIIGPAALAAPLQGHAGSVSAVLFQTGAISPALISAGDDGAVRRWDISTYPAAETLLSQQENAILALALTADGRTLASGSDSGAIHLWAIADPSAQAVTLTSPEGHADALAFSPDGRRLASAGTSGIVYLWDVANPAAAPVSLTGHDRDIGAVAFSPDGRLLASGGFDGTVRLWSMASPSASPEVLRGHRQAILTLAFSPDGRLLASSGDDRTIQLWRMADRGAEPIILPGHAEGVFALAFSPDGQVLASGSLDRSIQLWNMSDLSASPSGLMGHQQGVLAVTFSPDGQLLASAGQDGLIRLWPVKLDKLVELACQQVRRNMNVLEWQQFVGAEVAYRRTCSDQPVHPTLVDAARRLARSGDVAAAATQLQYLLSLDPSLSFDPAAEAERELHSAVKTLLDEGRTLARGGQVQQAVSKFRQAGELDPTLELEPEAEAERLAAQTAANLVEAGLDLVEQGDLAGALANFEQAEKLDGTYQVPARAWHSLCVAGSELGQANQALEACNRAVELEPDNGLYRSSRGAVLLELGDRSGAAADFKFFREWLEQQNQP